MTAILQNARRVVVKVGSTLLIESDTGHVRRWWLSGLADDLAKLRSAGADVLVVSSGAVALGRHVLGKPGVTLKLEEKQAAAAVGQIALAHAWTEALASRGLAMGQILLTLYDTEERRRYLNANATMVTLMRHKAIPVINENDTVATSQIRYGDNDRLAARVASMVSADCLVLLSDVDGLYSAQPGTPDARLVPYVDRITPEITAMAGKSVSGSGSGGMVTKLDAARIATAAGASMIIASGRIDNPLTAILNGKPCTCFSAMANPVTARKRWIAGSLEPAGEIHIDDGAARALARGRSLLPAGVQALTGAFARGDAVRVIGPSNREIARGLVAYDLKDAQRIAGRRSSEIEAILGFKGRNEIIHRDNLALIGDAT